MKTEYRIIVYRQVCDRIRVTTYDFSDFNSAMKSGEGLSKANGAQLVVMLDCPEGFSDVAYRAVRCWGKPLQDFGYGGQSNDD